jgi:hypothetical protein
MKQVGISGDYLEWKRQREEFEYAQKLHASGEFDRISQPRPTNEKTSRITRLRRWLFTPRGALAHFGTGYAIVLAWVLWSIWK